MSEFNKYSTDGGATFIDVEDSNAVHYGEQSKGYVGKNLFSPYSPNVLSQAGITLTENGDGTFTANGTATANAFFSLYYIDGEEGYKFKANNYRLSGCPTGGSGSNYSMKIQNLNNTSEQYDDFGSGVDVACNGTDKYKVYIIIRNGYHADNLVFKPMLTLENVPDSDYAHYEPWCMSNRELTTSKADDVCTTGSHSIQLIVSAITPTSGQPEFFIPWNNPSKKGITFDSFKIYNRENSAWHELTQASAPIIQSGDIKENGFYCTANLNTALTTNSTFALKLTGNIVFS